MKGFKKFLLTVVAPYLIYSLVRLIFLTNKKRFHYANIDKDETILIACWHGDLLMQPLNYYSLRKKGKVKVVVSQHKDGEIVRKVYEHFNVEGIQGSSSKGAVKALLYAIKEVRNGFDVAITPDGPRGPRHTVADGLIAIAQKTGTRIVTFNSKPTKYWQLKSWDRFVIPKPFGEIDFFISEPFSVEGLEMDEAKALIHEKLMINTMD